jgi:WXXGXW repeat (2 copies)
MGAIRQCARRLDRYIEIPFIPELERILTMWKRKLLLGALATASIGVLPLPAAAAVSLFVDIAPPAPRYEAVPAPRAGYVWTPGFWDYRSGHHVWAKGHWERERHGYKYQPARWEQRDGKWTLEKSRWDRDGDGVPDNRDRAPNNPHRQ